MHTPLHNPVRCGDQYEQDLSHAKIYFYSGDFAAAKKLLGQMTRQDYSMSRMDELLQWMERCELCLADPLKSRRQITAISEKLKYPE
jgi:hypothetical protein